MKFPNAYFLPAVRFAFVALAVVVLSSSLPAGKAEAAASNTLSGYAWSDNTGWISFNCTDGGPTKNNICGTSNYGVISDQGTGVMSGFAWSDNIGWISFNATDVTGCPSGSCNPTINTATGGAVTGWAKALSGAGRTDGWDGWIQLSGASFSGTAASGYSWGSDVTGWISWSGSGYGVVRTLPAPAASCTLTAAPTSIATGSSSTLSWTTTNATSFSIDNSIGSVTPVTSGSKSVTPTVTTTYTGTTAGAGSPATCTASVTITSAPINGSCSATHYNCSAGTSTNNVSGSTSYTWSCAGTNGGTTASCSEPKSSTPLGIIVSPTSYTASPSSTVSATYTLSNGTSVNTVCRLLSNSGTPLNAYAACTGSMSFSAPTTAGTYGYSIQANKSSTGETVTSNAFTVTVNPSTPAPTATLTASPMFVASGGRPTLTWSSTNATSCSTSANWSTAGRLSGSTPTNPLTSDTTFTLQCTGPGGTSSLQSVTVAVAGSAPVNGVCAATHYNCSAGVSTNNVSGGSAWTWSCAGVNGGTTASCSQPKNPTAPTASLSASPNPVTSGGRSTLTWSSTNATSCSTSANWSTAGRLSGSTPTNPLTSDTTFTFQCTGPGGTSPLASVTVTVSLPSSCTLPWGGTINSGSSVTAYQTPSVTSPATCTSQTRTCTGGTLSGSYVYQSCSVIPTATLSASPFTVNSGNSSTLTWSSAGATSCTFVGSPPNGISTGGATSGSISTGTLTSTQNYQVTCSNAGNTSAPALATVTVIQPNVSISATPTRVHTGNTSTIAWSSSQTISCAVSGPGLSASGLSGSQVVTINAQSTYTITCQTAGSPVTASAVVNILSLFQEF